MEKPYFLDKRLVAQAFSHAAESYDRVAVLQRKVGFRMLERLDYIRINPEWILDAGASTGWGSRVLAEKYTQSNILSLDLAEGMMHYAYRHPERKSQQNFVCGDMECLPLAQQSVDLIFSNLSVQWCNQLDWVFQEFSRVLKPGGLLMFTTVGPNTLQELRSSWNAVDGDKHVNAFWDMHTVGDLLIEGGFANPVMDTQNFTLTYPDIFGLMRDLKDLGAHNVTQGRPKGLLGKRKLRALETAYEQYRRKEDNTLPASYEIIYGHAWKQDNEVRVPLETIKRRT